MKRRKYRFICLALLGSMLLASCAEQGLPTPADTTDNSITENNGESVDMYVTDLMAIISSSLLVSIPYPPSVG